MSSRIRTIIVWIVVLLAAGATPALVSAQSTSGSYIPKTITVTPPGKHAPGDPITITGTGTPGANLTIRMVYPDGTVIELGQVTVGADGTYSLKSNVPSNAPSGTYTVQAVGKDDPTTVSTTLIVEANVLGTTTIANRNATAAPTVKGTTVDRGPLGKTGADIRPLVIAASVAFGLGLLLVALRRRRDANDRMRGLSH